MRKELIDPASWLSRQTLEHVLEITVGIVAVELGGLDQAHYVGSASPGAQRAGKQILNSASSLGAKILGNCKVPRPLTLPPTCAGDLYSGSVTTSEFLIFGLYQVDTCFGALGSAPPYWYWLKPAKYILRG